MNMTTNRDASYRSGYQFGHSMPGLIKTLYVELGRGFVGSPSMSAEAMKFIRHTRREVTDVGFYYPLVVHYPGVVGRAGEFLIEGKVKRLEDMVIENPGSMHSHVMLQKGRNLLSSMESYELEQGHMAFRLAQVFYLIGNAVGTPIRTARGVMDVVMDSSG